MSEEGGIELPSTFDQWPRDDQLEYLEHTKKKRELIDSTFLEAGLENEASGETNPSLSKLDWVQLYLRVRSLNAGDDLSDPVNSESEQTCDWLGCDEPITHPAIRPSGTSVGGFCDEHSTTEDDQ